MDIYVIYTSQTFGNSHTTNRDETWTIKLFEPEENISDPYEYVRSQNLKLPYFAWKIRTDNREFADRLLEHDIHECRWFVGYPPIKKIKAKLISKGIKIATQ
jgi:hypothetical protein